MAKAVVPEWEWIDKSGLYQSNQAPHTLGELKVLRYSSKAAFTRRQVILLFTFPHFPCLQHF